MFDHGDIYLQWQQLERFYKIHHSDIQDKMLDAQVTLIPEDKNSHSYWGNKEVTVKYVDIFFSPALSNYSGVQYASPVATFLLIWRNYITSTRVLMLKETHEGFLGFRAFCCTLDV